jgi:hypothetical protein
VWRLGCRRFIDTTLASGNWNGTAALLRENTALPSELGLLTRLQKLCVPAIAILGEIPHIKRLHSEFGYGIWDKKPQKTTPGSAAD